MWAHFYSEPTQPLHTFGLVDSGVHEEDWRPEREADERRDGRHVHHLIAIRSISFTKWGA